jgi:acetate kinase
MILVINCGSSSVKFAVINPASGETSLVGLAEKLGSADACISFKTNGVKTAATLSDTTHTGAMNAVIAQLTQADLLSSIRAVGHRIVHGGAHFHESTLINAAVLEQIKQCEPLAPLHAPANILGIQIAQQHLPQLPHVAVFDTAFHHNIPEHAHLYAIPKAISAAHQVRRYGFHGTSHRFVAAQAAQMLGKPLTELALISAHLGNGGSVAAILNGVSVDTSMGFTPLEGLIMGTRSGDIDAGLLPYLGKALNLDTTGVIDLLNKQSGLLGVSELSNDCRELEEAAANGHAGAILALEMYVYRLAKYIASYVVPLGRVDALIFTGGIGENSPFLRAKVLNLLAFLGFKLDDAANQAAFRGKSGNISSGVAALVINTDEEWLIAQDTALIAAQ